MHVCPASCTPSGPCRIRQDTATCQWLPPAEGHDAALCEHLQDEADPLTLCAGLQDTCSVPKVQAELERFGQYVGKMLLFLRFLRGVRVSTWAMGAVTPQQTLRVSSCAGTGIVLRHCTVCAVVPTCQLPNTLAVADTAFLYFRQTWPVTSCGSCSCAAVHLSLTAVQLRCTSPPLEA